MKNGQVLLIGNGAQHFPSPYHWWVCDHVQGLVAVRGDDALVESFRFPASGSDRNAGFRAHYGSHGACRAYGVLKREDQFSYVFTRSPSNHEPCGLLSRFEENRGYRKMRQSIGPENLGTRSGRRTRWPIP